MGANSFVLAGVSATGALPFPRPKGILVATPHCLKHPQGVRKLIEVAQPQVLIQDSGGFQVFQAEGRGTCITSDPRRPAGEDSMGYNVHPIHVLEVARFLRPNYVIALDRPIRQLDTRREREVEFHKKLADNVLWARITATLLSLYCPDSHLLIAVQAYTLKQFYVFYRAISDLRFDGFSMPTRNLNAVGILLFLEEFYHLGIREVHLLGTTKPLTLALGAWMARHAFDWVSIDSQSWRQNATNQAYVDPRNLRNLETQAHQEACREAMSCCTCSWCTRTTFADLQDMDYTSRTEFLMSHNARVIEDFCRDMYEASTSVFTLVQELNKRLPQAAWKDISALADALTLFNAKHSVKRVA